MYPPPEPKEDTPAAQKSSPRGRLWQCAHPQPLCPLQGRLAPRSEGKAKYNSAIVSPQSGVLAKIGAQQDARILEFLNKQAVENTRLMQVLSALDDYFKTNASPLDRSKIKGIKPELSFVKSIMVKINQSKAEYIALIEEQEQMRKLGISK